MVLFLSTAWAKRENAQMKTEHCEEWQTCPQHPNKFCHSLPIGDSAGNTIHVETDAASLLHVDPGAHCHVSNRKNKAKRSWSPVAHFAKTSSHAQEVAAIDLSWL